MTQNIGNDGREQHLVAPNGTGRLEQALKSLADLMEKVYGKETQYGLVELCVTLLRALMGSVGDQTSGQAVLTSIETIERLSSEGLKARLDKKDFLGMKLVKTSRGFLQLLMPQYVDEKMTVVVGESSAIGTYVNSLQCPGSSFLWIGQNHHLNRRQVRVLIGVLTNWLVTRRLVDESYVDEKEEEAKLEECGWVIEKDLSDPARPEYYCGGSTGLWTRNNEEAIRFARNQDAAKFVEAMGRPHRVCEHVWS